MRMNLDTWLAAILFLVDVLCEFDYWAIPFNKGTPLWMTELLPTLGQKFCLDTPRTDSSLRRITGKLLKFTREYEDILACQYPLGQTLKNHP